MTLTIISCCVTWPSNMEYCADVLRATALALANTICCPWMPPSWVFDLLRLVELDFSSPIFISLFFLFLFFQFSFSSFFLSLSTLLFLLFFCVAAFERRKTESAKNEIDKRNINSRNNNNNDFYNNNKNNNNGEQRRQLLQQHQMKIQKMKDETKWFKEQRFDGRAPRKIQNRK